MASPLPLARYAFLEPLNLVGLILGFLLLLFLGAPPLAWLALLVVELLWVGVGARTKVYRRRARLKHAEVETASRTETLALRAAQLRRDDRRRFQAIQKEIDALAALIERKPGLAGGLDRDRLNDLLEGALELSLSRQAMREKLDSGELERLQAESEPSDPALQDMRRRRIAGLESMKVRALEVENQLDLIEQNIHLLHDQLSTLSEGTDASSDALTNVGDLMRDVEATRRTIREMQALDARLGS